MANPVALGLLAWARKLKFPTLFKMVAALFVVNMFIPDPIPFLDEILLGLGTILLASWKDRNATANDAAAPDTDLRQP